MARLAHEEGMHLDVSTGGEYHVARSAGVPAERLVLHGNNKSLDELRTAMADGVGRIVVDSFDELDRIERARGRGRCPCPRCWCGSRPASRPTPTSSSGPARTTRSSASGWRRGRPRRRSSGSPTSPAVELVGMHAHIGSQVFEAEFFELAVEVLAPFFADYDLPELSIGGGLGVAYVEGEEAPSITAVGGRHPARSAATPASRAWVTAEPGRAIVASAGVTLYTVGTIKDLPDIRTYVSVDGGMSDNPRPVLYGSGYETFLPRDVLADRPRTVRVVGKHCESGDLLVREAQVPADLAVGDVLCTPVTGAYGHSMGSNYNKVPRPAVVFVPRRRGPPGRAPRDLRRPPALRGRVADHGGLGSTST